MTPEGDLGRVEIHSLPAEVEQLAAACAGIGSQTVEGEQPVNTRNGQEVVKLLGGPDPARRHDDGGVWIVPPG